MAENTLGIDFGTSFCTMCRCNPETGKPEVIRDECGLDKIPSVVYWGPDGDLRVGDAAVAVLQASAAMTPEKGREARARVIASVKRRFFPDRTIALPGGEIVYPVDVAAAILKYLKRNAEERCFHGPVRSVTLTHPASFTKAQKELLEAAGRKAGFEIVLLLEEPVAAAMGYVASGAKIGKGVLVYDLGGGTLDLAFVTRDESGFRVPMASCGDASCGGDDFDQALYDYAEQDLLKTQKVSFSEDEGLDLLFLLTCRQIKERLSQADNGVVRYFLEKKNVAYTLSVDRKTFEGLIAAKVSHTSDLVATLLKNVRKSKLDVDTVVLVGGSSRIPLVRGTLEKTVNPIKPLATMNDDSAVAMGAALNMHTHWAAILKTITEREVAARRKVVNRCLAVSAVVAVSIITAWYMLRPEWLPGTRHPIQAHLIAGDSRNTWRTDPGYRLKDVRDVTKGVAWLSGLAHPDNPRLKSSVTEGKWDAAPGYEWIGGSQTVWKPGVAKPDDVRVCSSQAEGEWTVPTGYILENGHAIWKPGLRHPTLAHVLSADKEGTWSTDPGYVLKDDTDISKGTVWKLGLTYPGDARVTSAQTEGEWVVPPGYILENGRAAWKSSKRHPSAAHVFAADREGAWKTDPGYELKDASDPSGGAVWKSGFRHPSVRHVVASDRESYWEPDPGYEWIESGNVEKGVRWKPGIAHPDNAHVCAAQTEGEWTVPPGYDLEGNRAVWKPGRCHPSVTHVFAADAEASWKPDPGYTWLDSSVMQRGVRWNPGARHPSIPHIFADDKEHTWDHDPGYEWIDSSCVEKGVRWKPGVKISENRRTGNDEGTFEIWNKCDRCGGRGTVSKNETTYCPNCNGTGRVDCPYKALRPCTQICGQCGGRKMIATPFGGMPCFSCNPEGKVFCPTCGGCGTVPCAVCMGTGGKNTQRVTHDCPDCNGAGGLWR